MGKEEKVVERPSGLPNVRIRKAMLDTNISQVKLAEMLDVSQSEVSHFMKWELAQREQDYIISKIREGS
jgi:predicted XRE-type DNA-binding protein